MLLVNIFFYFTYVNVSVIYCILILKLIAKFHLVTLNNFLSQNFVQKQKKVKFFCNVIQTKIRHDIRDDVIINCTFTRTDQNVDRGLLHLPHLGLPPPAACGRVPLSEGLREVALCPSLR